MDKDEQNEEPDFSAFADWHVAEQEEEWPPFWEVRKKLTDNQKRIIRNNVELLLDKEKWNKHVDAFEFELSKILDTENRKNKRIEFNIHFDGYNFSKENKDFSYYYFPSSVTFNDTQFGDGDVSFYKVQFGEGKISFENAKFGKGNIAFNQAQFREGEISFSDALFGAGDISFANAQFSKGSITFYKAQFGEGKVIFYNVQFGKGHVSFTNTQFQKGYISFTNAKFEEGDISFISAEFGDGDIDFINTQFGEGNVLFDNAQLKKANITFSYNIFKGSFFMRNVFFPQEADFHSLTFKGPAFFSDCQFKKTPNFRDTIFERPIEISNIDIPTAEMNSHWLSPKAVNKEDVHKYRKLKSMAQDTHDHIMEGYFFAQEMRAKRGVEITSFWELLLNELYYIFSNYGQSYWRPLIGLFGSFYLFSIIYKLIMFPHLKGFDAGLVALDYSLRHTLPFTGSLLRFSPRPESHQSWFLERLGDIGKQGIALEVMAYIGLIQSILGLILLFLLALGLRNAFRMK